MTTAKMRNTCRLIAEHIQRIEINEDLHDEMKFVRHELVEMLMDKGNQDELTADYHDSISFENPAPSAFLQDLTNRFFN